MHRERYADALAEAERAVRRIAQKIELDEEMLPTFGRSEESGRPHVDVALPYYFWIVSERGSEGCRRRTLDLDELLYWVLEDATFKAAGRFELEDRSSRGYRPGELVPDPRKLMFERQLHLLARLNPRWLERCRLEQEAIVREHPFQSRAYTDLSRT